MQGLLLLCDFAEEIGGKLYIMGGGWSRLVKKKPTVSVALAAKVLVPWNQTNSPMTLELSLISADGQPVTLGEPPSAVRLEGNFEVGRPPGLAPGSEIDVPLTFKFDDMPLDIGRYRWELKIGAEPVADATFDVVAP